MKNKNLYEILGLTPNATKDEIKAAYRKLVRVYHPDVNKTPEAEKFFKLLNSATETLLDDTKRLQYDTLLGFSAFKNEAGEKGGAKKNAKDDFKGGKPGAKQAETKAKSAKEGIIMPQTPEFSEFYKKENLKNAYKSSFDRNENAETKAPQPKINGKDIETVVKISESERKRGTARRINVLHTDKCPKCLGRKYFDGSVCSLCLGAGEKSEHKKMNVKIPAGIKNGTKIKIKNEGEYGKFGGKNGDLYLLVQIEKDAPQKFEGNKIITEVSIAPWQAVLGGKIEVPYNGKSVFIEIPPLTKSMTRFKLNKEAEKSALSDLKAEHIAIVKVDIPENLTAEEIELYRKLKIIAENK